MELKENKKLIHSEVDDIPGVGGIDRKGFQTEEARPEYVLEGREDEVYHESRLPLRGNEPEYVHLDKSWTFNRAMRWIEADNGTILCYSAKGELPLTGKNRVCEWFTDTVNLIKHKALKMHFEKISARKRDCVISPGFQFHLGQHPVLEIAVSSSDAEWQCCVIVKGRSGSPLLSTGWEKGAASVYLDIASAYRQKGINLNFAEIHIAFGFWCPTGEKASASLSIKFPAQDAVVASLPVACSAETVAKSGLPITALAIDAKGRQFDPEKVSLSATLLGREFAMRHSGGVWTANMPDIPAGEHYTLIRCRNAGKVMETSQILRVTHGNFISYSQEQRSLFRKGKALGPISGSYQGMVFFDNIGKNNEHILQGEHAAETELKANPIPRWHYWEALTENELELRIAYLENCGYDLIHLSQGSGIWEKLDAGGKIAPHGAEQLSLFLRVASRHGLTLLIALTHYPYGSRYTQPPAKYLDNGFRDEYWVRLEPSFSDMFHCYLSHVGKLWKDDDVIAAFSTSGEGDIAAGPERVNDTCSFMHVYAPNHLFVSEPIHRMTELPGKHILTWVSPEWIKDRCPEVKAQSPCAWNQSLFGSRLYWIGEKLHPEIDLSIEFKFMGMGDFYMGEGSWPCPKLYAKFMGIQETWSGTERYRLRIRDSLYIGLIHRSPILLTWEEQFFEDEHAVLREIRGLVDWSQAFKDAPVMIRVDSANVGVGSWGIEGRLVLGRYEEYFSALPLATNYLQNDEPAPQGVTVIDARKPYVEPALSAAMLTSGPLLVSPGYRIAYLWSADRRTLLAYIYNCTGHDCLEGRRDGGLSGNWHRVPVPIPLSVELRSIPGADKSRVRLYNLDKKQYATVTHQRDGVMIKIQKTKQDYLLVMYPER